MPYWRTGLVVACSLVLAGPLCAQLAGTLEGDGAVGPWHVAETLPDGPLAPSLTPREVLRTAQAQLILGRPGRALAILSEHPLADSALSGMAAQVFADALYAQERYSLAAPLYVRAATFSSTAAMGRRLGRAGEAYERAGRPYDAVRLYQRASTSLPEMAEWFVLRRAALAKDTAAAFAMLDSAPVAARGMAAEIRAGFYEQVGDTTRALAAWQRAGRFARAAWLSWITGDSVASRALAHRAIEDGGPEEAEQAVDFALEHLPPHTSSEYRTVANWLSRHGRAADATTLLSEAVQSVDSSAAMVVLLGEAAAASGDRWRALRLYERAAGEQAPEAAEAEFRRARLLLGLKRRTAAGGALRAFVAKYPAHEHTPLAIFLIGDLHQDAGRIRQADSAYRVLADAWSDDRAASRARLRLASLALRRADTSEARRQYRVEVARRGAQAAWARFELALLAQAGGDTVAARAQWSALAVEDSLGYYGTIARQAAGLPLPLFDAIGPLPQSDPGVRKALAALDALEAMRFQQEVAAVIEWLTDVDEWNTDQLLEIAEGLTQRGRSLEGIRLGWKLTGELTLDNPRVIRVIFPWPNRALVEREASKFGLDPYLVAGLIRQESAFDPGATSHVGARGLMQLMPSTARGLARRLGIEWSSSMLTIADANAHVGMAHLAALLRQYEGKVIPALAAYNAGGRPVARWLRFPEANDPVRFVERIPYRETRGYVRTVLRNRALYQALYGGSAMP